MRKLLLLLFLPLMVFGQTTTHIHDTILNPSDTVTSGSTVSGTLTLISNSWDVNGKYVVKTLTPITITNGVIDVNLAPNDTSTNNNSYYTANYSIKQNGNPKVTTNYSEKWQVPTTDSTLTVTQVLVNTTTNPAINPVLVSQITPSTTDGDCIITTTVDGVKKAQWSSSCGGGGGGASPGGTDGQLQYRLNSTTLGGMSPKVNGVAITTPSAMNFINSDAFHGLTFSFSNPSAGGIKIGASGTLDNDGLTHDNFAVTYPSWLTGPSVVALNGTLSIGGATAQASHKFIGTCGTATTVDICALTSSDIPALSYEPPISTGLSTQYWRGDKTWQTLNAAAVANAVDQTGSYSNPDWVSSLSWAKLTSVPSSFTPSAHASSHKFGGSDPVATATPSANAIPQAGSGGTLSATWLPLANGTTDGYLSQTDWSTFNNKQAALGFTPENVTNKSTSTSLGISNTLYPTQNAVKQYVDTGLLAKQDNLGFTPLNPANNLSELTSTASTARTNLGLGTASTHPSTDFEVPLTFGSGLNRTTNTITIPNAGVSNAMLANSTIAFVLPSWLSGNGPTALGGTFTASAATGQATHKVLGTCGTATSVSLCSLVPGDIPTLNQNTTGTANNIVGITADSTFTQGNGSGGVQSSGKTVPSGAVVGTTDTQTLSNKTVDGASPTEIGYVAGVTSAIQTQINGKQGLCSVDTSVTTTYTVTTSDFSACKTFLISSGTFTITLVASGSQPANGQSINILNIGSGSITIAPSGQNLNGTTSSIVLGPGSASTPSIASIKSDGTNYIASSGSSFPGTTCTNQFLTGITAVTGVGVCGDSRDVKIVPFAAAPGGTAGSGVSYASGQWTPTARGGTNSNIGAALQAVPSTGAALQFLMELPADWDSSNVPSIRIVYGSGSNTSGHVGWTVSSACTKSDGSVSDDPTFQVETAFTDQVLASANKMWAQTGQITKITTANNCVAGGSVIIKLALGAGTSAATAAINAYQAIVTVPTKPNPLQAE